MGCGKSFMYASNLQVHMVSHTHAKSHPNYTCDLCNKGFKSEGGIRLHRRKIHNIGHVCEISEHGKICNKKFSSHRSLSIHHREAHCLIVNFHEPHVLPKRCELSKILEQKIYCLEVVTPLLKIRSKMMHQRI